MKNFLRKVSPFFLLFILCLSAFWPYLIGEARFIGDSDRLSHYLGYLFAVSNSLANGYVATWNDSLFMGYGMLSTPYMFPNPFLYLESLPSLDPIYVATIVACLLMFLESIFCFIFLRSLQIARVISFSGSVLYIFSSASVLRISQNECTFYSFLMAPLLFYLVNISSSQKKYCSSLIYQSLAIAFLLFTGFYQEIAYLLLVLGIYSLWLCYRYRTYLPTTILITSTIISAFSAFPRILTVGQNFSNSIRHYTEGASSNFEIVYRQVNTVSKNEILRLFDDRIFGLTMPEALKISKFDLNLHEGLVLYVSSIAIFFVIIYFFKNIFRISNYKNTDLPIFLAICIGCICVTLTKSGYYVMYKLFMDVDFMHGRIVVYATLPLVASVCILLQDWIGKSKLPTNPSTYFFTLILSLILISISEIVIDKYNFPYLLNTLNILDTTKIYYASFIRIFFSAAFVTTILILGKIIPKYKIELGLILLFSMIIQSTFYGFGQIKGSQLQTDNPPFLEPVRLMAKKTEFLRPTKSTRDAIHNALDSNNFRAAIVCDRTVTTMPCSTFIANFWDIDSPDGYVSSIPERLSRLPWGESMSLRYITFWKVEQLPWRLLGLLNVKYALVANKQLLTNSIPVDGSQNRQREVSPEDLVIHKNPYPVMPRVFFTSNVMTVANEDEAVEKLNSNLSINLVEKSIVEGFSATEQISSEGNIEIIRKGQDITILVTPSKFFRFLVLNDLYESNWKAYANNHELRIYPTNVVMRGIFLPPGATEINMQYRPIITRWWSLLFPMGGIFLLFIILFFKRKCTT